ncbi:MAG: ATPase, T2SS/T4P/T4SS family [Candidatus Neomarinimicrobiota bacterium]
MVVNKKKLGQLFVEAGKMDKSRLEEALVYKKEHNINLGQAFVALMMLTEDEVIKMVSEQLRIPWIDPLTYRVKNKTLNLISEKRAKRLKVMPLFHFENVLTVACADQNNINVVDELSDETVMEINIVLATEINIEQALDLHHDVQSAEELEVRQRTLLEKERIAVPSSTIVSTEISTETKIIEAVDMLMEASIKMGASDIHIEPREKDVRVRFRVDGILNEYYTLPAESLSPMISRIKILSGMDIAETRRSRDGRFRHAFEDKVADIRTASFPTPTGEKIVMRILDISKGQITLENLGFSDEMYEQWNKVAKLAHGLILVTGPTGSGKSTTLYATLGLINTVEVNVLTVEDPIEYQLENINQSQINEKAGVTFSSSLRAMLRLDPDIIMVGEMRDRETIELAIRAALTGHIVFSTLHTNDAASAYTRILNMGVDAFLVSSTVRAILAQRLLRRLCEKCKKAVIISSTIRKRLELPDDFKGELFKPVGCHACAGSGYVGRAGVYELLIPDDEITDLINKHATSTEIDKVARKNKMITLNESARQFVLDGTTSVEEMVRISLI